jgi:alkanesulfonate monooxygenase SsuD/methylene tetrahydromethanopterin reductase-like flavin-dependent oxidoreductase (luciferase family)
VAHFILRFDMRAPAFGAGIDELYAAALDMAAFADEAGFDEIMLSEHHGSEDGYLPSPLTLAAAIAARTSRVRIRISALVLPLHDPIRVAEDVAVVDRLSGGRLELVIAAGFVPGEFAMLGASLARRGALVEEGVRVLRAAWTGEPFQHRGHRVRVTPTPLQRPHPPLLLGGSSPAAARRAARIGDGFVPILPELYAVYEEACRAEGRTPAPDRVLGPPFLHVSNDPDADWARIAPHALHETNAYGAWYAEAGITGPYQPIADADALRASGLYSVQRPAECSELIRGLGDDPWIFVHPLLGGMDPALGWQSLQLLTREVMPELAG